MQDYIDVTVDIVSQDDFRYRVQTNPDIPELVDILYQEEKEDGTWETKASLEMLPMPLLERLAGSARLVHSHSHLVDDISN